MQYRVEIQYRVQHSAGRNYPLSRLLERLPPSGIEVFTDDAAFTDPNPWRNYLRCVGEPCDATHLCVIQDDALPCDNFDLRLREAVAEKPDDVLSMFVGGLPSKTKRDFLQALKAGERWSPIWFREIHHVVCLVWPVGLACEFTEWAAINQLPGQKNPRSDDAVVGFWARKTRRHVWAHVPCLVEHPDDLPSVVQGNRRLGDAGRKAIYWVP